MAMDYFIANRHRRFTQLFHRLQQQHPQLRLVRQQTALERLRERMRLALETQMKRADQRQQRVIQRLNLQNPQPRIHRAQTRIQQLEYRLAENIHTRLSEQRERFGNAVTHLEAVSPLATLARGYSVTSASDGKVLKQTKQVKTGDLLTTRLNDGWVESEVKTITAVKKLAPVKKHKFPSRTILLSYPFKRFHPDKERDMQYYHYRCVVPPIFCGALSTTVPRLSSAAPANADPRTGANGPRSRPAHSRACLHSRPAGTRYL
jgi:hypothetical protein